MDPYHSFNYQNSVEANNNQQFGVSQYQNNWNNSLNLTNVKMNRSIYINQNFQGSQVLPVTSNKVLINPNFLVSSKVHINPSYIKTKGIFINPHVLPVPSNLEQTASYNINTPKSTTEVLVSTKNKWVRKCAKIATTNTLSAIPNLQSTSRSLKTPLKYTKYKIIRKDTSPKRKRRTSINLRYKLIRSNSNKPKSTVINNKFRLDRRNSSERIKSKLYLTNKAYRLKVDHKISILKRHSLTSNKMTLVKGVDNVTIKRGTARMSRILNISGRKYKMDNNKMVLKLAMTGDASKLTVKVRKSDQFKIPLRKKLKTNNIPCPTYHRFGICQRHKRGMCQKVHNSDQIIVCSKFLQGVCYNDDCLLSHKICPSKMATCKFYLDGLCTKDGCPYLHVKVNSTVAICKDFLAGFCQLGKECDKRHELLCPDFEQNGRCSKRNCQFPHRNNKRLSVNKLKVRNVKYNKVPKNPTSGTDQISSNVINKRYYEEANNKRNSAILNNSNVLDNESSLMKIKKSVNICDAVSSANVNVENICAKQDDQALVVSKKDSKSSDSSSNDNDENTVVIASLFYNRPQLGILPTFIPF